MISHLGMYDMPEIMDVTDRFWSGIRHRLPDAPAALTRNVDPWDVWQSPVLLLSQTCGLPYRARLHGTVSLVGTPVYDLPDCAPGHYFSYLIRRTTDRRDLAELAKGTMAYNETLSQSGWAAPLAHLALHGLMPAALSQTGSHALSALAVLNGQADFAAIDAVTWKMMSQLHPEMTAGLDAFERTVPTPALPYITALGRDPDPIANAVAQAISQLSATDRSSLVLRGFTRIPAADYLALPIPPAP